MYEGDPFEDKRYEPYLKIIEAQRSIFRTGVSLIQSPRAVEQARGFTLLEGLSDAVSGETRMLLDQTNLPNSLSEAVKEVLAIQRKRPSLPSLFDMSHPPAPVGTNKVMNLNRGDGSEPYLLPFGINIQPFPSPAIND